MKVTKCRSRNVNKIIVAQLNINSIRNKFELLRDNIGDLLDVIMISETKIDESFPVNQFALNGYTPYRLDRSGNGGGILLYIKRIFHQNFLVRSHLMYRTKVSLLSLIL